MPSKAANFLRRRDHPASRHRRSITMASKTGGFGKPVASCITATTNDRSSEIAMKRVCVFCGASAGLRQEYRIATQALASALARRGIGLVYGGGNVGLMGILADAMLQAGGEVTGVIPRSLVAREVAHRGVTALHVVDTMHQRKAMMNELSDAFVALPGGFGTLEEFFEILTWSQLGIHCKPSGLLNVSGYYDGLLVMLDHAVAEGFLRQAFRELVIADTDADALVLRLGAASVQAGPRESAAGNFL
jgi:uncharacterized protein (TIGR00730 family)